jgi:hypothetical protein
LKSHFRGSSGIGRNAVGQLKFWGSAFTTMKNCSSQNEIHFNPATAWAARPPLRYATTMETLWDTHKLSFLKTSQM